MARASAPLHGTQIPQRLAALGVALRESAALWRPSAFVHPVLPWEAEHPRLAARLRALSLAEAEALHAQPEQARRLLGEWLALDGWQRLLDVGLWPRGSADAWPHGFTRAVPGRKWSQVDAFVGALLDAGLPCVEWCAGKAHLGRALSQRWGGRAVLALERDPQLVGKGAALARRAALPLTARQCDVMDEAVMEALRAPVQVAALHACGDLHLRLIECAIASGVPALAIAPCCYHLTRSDACPGLSVAARADALVLTRADMRSAVQETVTAPGHARRLRRRVQQWQLGFDALQRELRATDSYLPIPAAPAALFSGDFAGYCRFLCERKGLALAPGVDLARFERAGRERFRSVTALDLVRHAFRRPLELRLALDRAQSLAENGYEVALGEFCARACSPRNLLIQATRA